MKIVALFFKKNYQKPQYVFCIPSDAARGFAAKERKSGRVPAIAFYVIGAVILVFGATYSFIALDQPKKAMSVAYKAESVKVLSVIEPVKKSFSTILDYGPYCDKNSQAPITGLLGEESSCNKAPEIKEGRYVDISLGNMLAILYEDGILVQEVAVLTRGCRTSPSPKGSFKVLSKYPKYFSRMFSVWMLWAMHIHGDYFLHGTPYYSNGQPVITPCSAGCIRFNIEDIQKIYNFADAGTPVIIYEK